MLERPTNSAPVSQELKELSDSLEQEGYEVQRLRQLERAVETLQRPPSVIGRLRNSVKQTTRQQWTLLTEEFAESKEALALARAALRGHKLSNTERDKLKSQLVDMFKLLPAAVVAAANTAIPLPGVALLTPWLLRKLSLLPSRWREAHLLAELQKEHDTLVESGQSESARRVLRVRDELQRTTNNRRNLDRDIQLLAHWDKNQDGIWNESERTAYDAEATRLKELAIVHGHSRRWFLSSDGDVFGPIRLEEARQYSNAQAVRGSQPPLPNEPGAAQPLTLLCYEGTSGWVALDDVIDTIGGASQANRR